MDLTVEVYKVTENFPKTELYGLVSQLRRASSSIPANIAEGYGRNFTKEERHFLSIAYGSLMEVETFLILSYRLGFMSAGLFRKIDATRNEVGKLVIGYRRSRQD
ncbi:four helix bundle protein [Candidatus Berkelbacteria bacterium]|nr:four helix bundle protein [Candidatus Berkelbacteria bacterium]